MKAKPIALLLVLALALSLCACSASPGESAPAVSPKEMEAKTPAVETADPGEAETAISGEPEAAEAETGPEAPAETPTPEPQPWQLAYRELLEDPALLDSLIGEAGDYRKGYFGGWETPYALLPFSDYAAADLTGDGTPELLLYSREMGLTDLISYQDGCVYLEYNDYLGFLPREGGAVIQGHWHGAGGSWFYEYAVEMFSRPGTTAVYFDHGDPAYPPMSYSFLEPDGSWSSGSDQADAERYDALYANYVLPCVRLEDIPFYVLDDLSGLERPCDLETLSGIEQIRADYRAVFRSFLENRGWQALGLNLAAEGLQAMLWDLDEDGVEELILNAGPSALAFRYDGGTRQTELLGEVPGEICGHVRRELVTRSDGVLCEYGKNDRWLRGYEASWLQESELEPLRWTTPEELAAQLG